MSRVERLPSFEAFTFERNINVTPNFSTYANKSNFNLTDVSKDKTKKYCHDLYDRFCKIELETVQKIFLINRTRKISI